MKEIGIETQYLAILFGIPLFRDLPENIRTSLPEKLECRLFEYGKNDIIARQATPCRSLYVLLAGSLQVDIIDASGNEVMIEDIIAPRAFATPHLFSKDNTLPATFTAREKGLLLTAPKEALFRLISEEPTLLKSFLRVTGNCNRCTVTRLHALSQKGIRNRIISYLFDHASEQGDTVHIPHNQIQLAEYLCVTRPALSRELNKMIKEGLITVDRKKIHIPDRDKLRRYIN